MMTVDLRQLRMAMRAAADQAARDARTEQGYGDQEEFQFQAGRQAGLLHAMYLLRKAEDAAAADYEADVASNMVDEAIGEEAARLGLIGYGRGVDLGAVERLEEFARNAEGAVDMASGTVHSDADEGL